MNQLDQRRIIHELCENLQRNMLRKLPRIPESWDGMELRELLTDTAREDFAVRQRDNRLGIWRDYRNDRLIHNL